jgi:1,4-dihydroxy-2-naphthoate polyprenyltransferase
MSTKGVDLSEPISASPRRREPGRIRVWFQAVRFFSFTASAIPILVGSALALVDRSFSPLLLMLMLTAAIACHAGANLANDYFDHLKEIDTDESLGPSKVIQQGLLSLSEVKRGMIVTFAIATAVGLVIVALTGWPILALALLSLGAAVLYTGGPKPLGYIALGEVTVFVFMGPVMVVGAYYVMTVAVTWQVFLVSLPVGLLVAAILHANNVRDIELDREAGKMTVANKFGRRFANWEYASLVWGSYCAILGLVISDTRLWPVLITFATVPVAMRMTLLVFSQATALELNQLLRKTAGLHLRFGTMLTVGLLATTALDRLT